MIRLKLTISVLIIFILTISSCSNTKISDNTINNTSTKTTNIKPTNTPTKDPNYVSAKKIITEFFSKYTDISSNNLCTNNLQRTKDLLPIIKEVKLLQILDDDFDENRKKGYLQNGRGSIVNPFDAICFQITYNIIYNDDLRDNFTPDNGKYTKWITLIKEKEISDWKIDEIGY